MLVGEVLRRVTPLLVCAYVFTGSAEAARDNIASDGSIVGEHVGVVGAQRLGEPLGSRARVLRHVVEISDCTVPDFTKDYIDPQTAEACAMLRYGVHSLALVDLAGDEKHAKQIADKATNDWESMNIGMTLKIDVVQPSYETTHLVDSIHGKCIDRIEHGQVTLRPANIADALQPELHKYDSVVTLSSGELCEDSSITGRSDPLTRRYIDLFRSKDPGISPADVLRHELGHNNLLLGHASFIDAFRNYYIDRREGSLEIQGGYIDLSEEIRKGLYVEYGDWGNLMAYNDALGGDGITRQHLNKIQKFMSDWPSRVQNSFPLKTPDSLILHSGDAEMIAAESSPGYVTVPFNEPIIKTGEDGRTVALFTEMYILPRQSNQRSEIDHTWNAQIFLGSNDDNRIVMNITKLGELKFSHGYEDSYILDLGGELGQVGISIESGVLHVSRGHTR